MCGDRVTDRLRLGQTGGARRAKKSSISGSRRARAAVRAPVAELLVLLAAYRLLFPRPLPALHPAFLLFCAAGGLAQIIATNLLISAFRHRNFVVFAERFHFTQAVFVAEGRALFEGQRQHAHTDEVGAVDALERL